jgi:hypothetical protein
MMAAKGDDESQRPGQNKGMELRSMNGRHETILKCLMMNKGYAEEVVAPRLKSPRAVANSELLVVLLQILQIKPLFRNPPSIVT